MVVSSNSFDTTSLYNTSLYNTSLDTSSNNTTPIPTQTSKPSFSFIQPMVSTNQIPLGTRMFLVAILLVVLAITSYLFYFRTDNVAVGYAQYYPTLFTPTT